MSTPREGDLRTDQWGNTEVFLDAQWHRPIDELMRLRAENEELKAALRQTTDESAERVRTLAEANERVGWECSALLSHLEQDAENFVSRGELITRLRMWMKWFAPREGE